MSTEPSGVGYDLYFADHRCRCQRCDDAEREHRFADLCLDGSVLWKRENVVIKRRPKTDLPQLDIDGTVAKNYRTSKAKAKALTRFKGDET